MTSCQDGIEKKPPEANEIEPLAESRLGFNDRIAQAIMESSGLDVTYKDHLGEGSGHWDQDPRYTEGEVNCMTWLQYVLAEVYTTDEDEKTRVMDTLRYYGGKVGFSFRKHYIDRWTELEPGPLSKITLLACEPDRTKKIELELDMFSRKIGYSCPLFRMDSKRFSIQFMTRQKILDCVRTLEPGYYVTFAVASNNYLKKYCGFSGPMAQVHGGVVEIQRLKARNEKGRETIFHHASISNGQVVTLPLGEYLRSMKNLHVGYTIYRLEPEWKWMRKSILDANDKKLLECESSMKGKAGRIFENEDTE